MNISDKLQIKCFHCGDECGSEKVSGRDHDFCCTGCKMVFEILEANDLHAYYKIGDEASIGIRPGLKKDYGFLDNELIKNTFLDFVSEDRCKFTIELPDIHCSSCIWLLEHIDNLNKGIIRSRVDFLNKTSSIVYDPRACSLREVVELLHAIGYAPRLNQNHLDKKDEPVADRSIYYKIGVAGFSFGNIMLLSFPDYLGMTGADNFSMLGYLNILLALPVLLYAASDYLRAAFNAIKVRSLGIDIPIAIGIIVLFSRSVYEILNDTGAGYLDSFAGFVLFLLIGKWFQQLTFGSISFDRDYRSFFPIAVLKQIGNEWQYVNVREIIEGDVIRIKNEEIIPCDGTLLSEMARVDYSFVTGEEHLKHITSGNTLFAGGKQKGSSISMKVEKGVNQSYLTQLWKDDVFTGNQSKGIPALVNRVGGYFVLIILGLALATMFYWLRIDASTAFKATTAVLIIACPCVLALSVPFIYGNMLRILARRQIFCRNTDVLEHIANLDAIVFDKTGTVTNMNTLDITFVGTEMSDFELSLIQTLASQSSHPLSKALAEFLKHGDTLDVTVYKEHIGRGLEGHVCGHHIRIGSPQFVLQSDVESEDTFVLVEINGTFKGSFLFKQELRRKIKDTVRALAVDHSVDLLSGDASHDYARMRSVFPEGARLLFNQKPTDKLTFIKSLQSSGSNVMMIGDGLNDAGAIRQSNVGVVISQSNNNFTPACDMIMSEESFNHLDKYIEFIKKGRHLLFGAFAFALVYNIVGLLFAMSGQLSPIVAAILMPASSVTIMIYGIVSTEVLRWRCI